MHRTLLSFLLAGALGALSAPALADGLDRSRIPQNVQAIVHLDVEALLASQLARRLQELDPKLDPDFDLGQQEPMLSGVRPLRDLRSLTIFAADARSRRFGAMVRTSDKADALLQLAMAAETYELVPLAGWQVHSWSEGGERVYGAVVPLGQSADRLVLLANDAQVMSESMAVLEGRGLSLAAGAQGQLALAPSPGTIVFAATNQPIAELSEVDPSSSVARLVQGLVLQLGEVNGSLFANLSLSTAQPQDALRVQQILQGLTALASLVSEDVEQGQALQQLVGALRFQTTGNLIHVEFAYELESLIRDLRSLEQR